MYKMGLKNFQFGPDHSCSKSGQCGKTRVANKIEEVLEKIGQPQLRCLSKIGENYLICIKKFSQENIKTVAG